MLSGNSSYILKSIGNNYFRRYIALWSNTFHLSVGWNKKRSPIMTGNCQLNINIEDHTANLSCLHRFFKNISSFLPSLISLYKNIFLPFGWKNGLSFHGRELDFANYMVIRA